MGLSTYYLYDKTGRKVAQVLSDGTLTEYVHDANNNLVGVTLLPTRAVNPYHLLGHQSVFLSEAAARKFSEALAK